MTRRLTSGRSPLVNPHHQITSFFSKQTPNSNPNPNPNNQSLSSPIPITPSPICTSLNKPRLFIPPLPSLSSTAKKRVCADQVIRPEEEFMDLAHKKTKLAPEHVSRKFRRLRRVYVEPEEAESILVNTELEDGDGGKLKDKVLITKKREKSERDEAGISKTGKRSLNIKE